MNTFMFKVYESSLNTLSTKETSTRKTLSSSTKSVKRFKPEVQTDFDVLIEVVLVGDYSKGSVRRGNVKFLS